MKAQFFHKTVNLKNSKVRGGGYEISICILIDFGADISPEFPLTVLYTLSTVFIIQFFFFKSGTTSLVANTVRFFNAISLSYPQSRFLFVLTQKLRNTWYKSC